MARTGSREGLGSVIRRLLAERLEPRKAAAAVFVGLTVGVVPIYGFQSLTALGLATVLRLNRPLTLGATFVNNPLLQPLLVFGSIQLGHRTLHGNWVGLDRASLVAGGFQAQATAFVVGSLLLAVSLAVPGAALAYGAFGWRARRRGASSASGTGSEQVGATGQGEMRRLRSEVSRRFAQAPAVARGFARWKVRLDVIFRVLREHDLGHGAVVDLGCGYGLALLLAALRDPDRPLHGCDLDANRVHAARQALAGFDAHLSVADARLFPIPSAGLILIVDVLQYFDGPTQETLLARCAAALQPGGRLIFRVPETKPGFRSRLTAWLDRVVFKAGGATVLPTYRGAADYDRTLGRLGLSVDRTRPRNRLPLSHVLFVCDKRSGGVDG